MAFGFCCDPLKAAETKMSRKENIVEDNFSFFFDNYQSSHHIVRSFVVTLLQRKKFICRWCVGGDAWVMAQRKMGKKVFKTFWLQVCGRYGDSSIFGLLFSMNLRKLF